MNTEKTKEQLIEELAALRKRVAELEAAEQARTEAEKQLLKEKEFIDTLVQASPAFFVAIDPDGKTRLMNEAMLNALGYSIDEVIGAQYLSTFVPESDRAELAIIFDQLVKQAQPTLNENHVLTRDGRQLLVEWHGRPVFKPNNEYGFFFGVGIDITKRKQIEEELRNVRQDLEQRVRERTQELAIANQELQLEIAGRNRVENELRISETRLRLLVEQSPLGVQIFSPDGRLLQVNRAWKELWGATLDKMVSDYNILADEQLVAKSVMPYIKKAFNGEAVEIPAIFYDPEAAMPNRIGDQQPGRWARAYSYPVKDEAGRISEVVLIHEDITEQKKALQFREDLLAREQEARKIAEEANSIKDEFIATVSHELRTPLTAMLGWVRLLREGKLEAGASARALETVERNVKSQAQLIEDLLDISRIVAGKMRLSVQPVELAVVIREAADSLQPTVDVKNLQLRLAIDDQATKVLGDPNRLRQVVWNLLANAIKFTPASGCIELQLERVKSAALIRVSDSGQGIKQEFLPYVFDRFRQAESTLARKSGGLGLGLAIVKHLVELHGGTIRADSPGEGKGAIFTVQLPPWIMPEEPRERKRGERSTRGNRVVTITSELAGLNILVVDDELDDREFLQMVLEQCSANVMTAASVNEALGTLKECWPDLLISDIAMPDDDGYVLIDKVRAMERGAQLPAIALTGHARIEDRMKALSAGYQMQVSKPIEPEELIAIVASLTGIIGGREEQWSSISGRGSGKLEK